MEGSLRRKKKEKKENKVEEIQLANLPNLRSLASKNDNLFSDQVLVLLMCSDGRECEAVMKTVVLMTCILRYRCCQ